MIKKDKILEITELAIQNKSMYVVDVLVSANNQIQVFVDAEQGYVTIEECISISRFIEKELDRDVIDFSLDVSSPGLTTPFKHEKQYAKALNKEIEVTLKEGGKIKGILKQIEDKIIELEEKPSKKQKETKQHKIDIESIHETKYVIAF